MKYQLTDNSNDKKYFTIVPNYVLNHSSAIDQALYLQMKRLAGEDGTCFITQKHLCERLGVGKDKLRKSLQYLLDHKWVTFIGTTESKTKPINTYKVNDIWKLNTDYYQEKKKSPKSAQSFKAKDKTQIRPKIRPETDPLRRTNNKEELITNSEANASGFKGMASVRDLLSRHGIVKEKKKGGATFKWQDDAVRWWEKLNLNGKPTAGWFRIFKLNAVTAERACAWASDSGGRDLEKLTYWAFAQFRKNGKIVYDKSKAVPKF